MSDQITERFPIEGTYDFRASLSLEIYGGDPTVRRSEEGAITLGRRTPAGPGAVRLSATRDELLAEGFGPGGEWLVGEAPRLTGLADPGADLAFFANDATAHALFKKKPGLRLTMAARVFDSLVRIVLEQRVQTREACDSYRKMVYALSTSAPGPDEVMLPIDPSVFARLPYEELHHFEVEKARADTIKRAAKHQRKIDALRDAVIADPVEGRAKARALLPKIRGIGPWTSENLLGRALACPDAVPTGDYGLPNAVGYTFTNVERGHDDEEMLRLLAPFAGQRGRVVRQVYLAGKSPPRRGPRRKRRWY